MGKSERSRNKKLTGENEIGEFKLRIRFILLKKLKTLTLRPIQEVSPYLEISYHQDPNLNSVP